MQLTKRSEREVALPAQRAVPVLTFKERRVRLLRRIWKERWVYALVLPGFLYFVIFHYIPLFGNIIAWQDYSPYLGFLRSPWVGWKNFTDVFTDPDFWLVIQNTLVLNLLQIIFAFPAGIILALMLNSLASERLKRLMQSIVYLPHFIGWVIVISIWQQLFGNDGMLNHMIMGMGGHPFNITDNPDWFKPVVVLQVMWKESGWSTIIFMAAIANIDLNLYEAAAIDGAGKWRRMWHITLPGLRSIIVLLLILRMGSILSTGFEQIFLQQSAFGWKATAVIDLFIYNRGLLDGNWGMATAFGLMKTVIGTIMIMGTNTIVKKLGEEGLY